MESKRNPECDTLPVEVEHPSVNKIVPLLIFHTAAAVISPSHSFLEVIVKSHVKEQMHL